MAKVSEGPGQRKGVERGAIGTRLDFGCTPQIPLEPLVPRQPLRAQAIH